MQLEEIYTPLEEARAEIRRRGEDRDLRHRVEEFLGGPPPGADDAPRAFLCRSVQTPNREFFRFVERAEALDLTPYLFEHLEDRYCSVNADKRCLVRMTIMHGRGRRGDPIFERYVIVGGTFEGKTFPLLLTRWDEPLVDFHHRLLLGFFPEARPENNSRWITSRGPSLREFYPAYLARFVCHGVLVESYLETPHEIEFTHEVALPAFECVVSRFGVKPLIVRLLPPESEAEPTWAWYDREVEKYVVEALAPTKIRRARR
jgi:hypothetical protein